MQRLSIGIWVCEVGKSRRAMVVDFGPDQEAIAVAWRSGGEVVEKVVRRSALVVLPLPPAPAP